MPWQIVAIWIVTGLAVFSFIADEIALRRRARAEAQRVVSVADVERLRRLRLRSIGY